ncbi:MAG: glycine cleavage system aminomethyltransferase GcvT [Verrucomicrobia bacterium]|nr:glycine cleavage system aminomethyltransferase GcvT [Verrucomicrobiota bacterium]
MLRTPLHGAHEQRNARLVPFAGWSMPVQYPSGIVAEHRAVRAAAGIFDISHMGEFLVRGAGGRAWLDTLFSNNLATKLTPGASLYGFFLNDDGGVIDDLIVYEYRADEFLLVVNASKIAEDFAWLTTHPPPAGVELTNRSDAYAAFAIQGPRAPEIIAAWCAADAGGAFSAHEIPAKHGGVAAKFSSDGFVTILARTGYTGEDGFELFLPASLGVKTFDELLRVGAPFGLVPAGLGARDTLRLEVCYPLNGSDLFPDRTPLAAGLGFFVDLNKEPAFRGRDALRREKESGGPREKLAAFRVLEKGPPPRAHYPIFHDGQQVGEIASGAHSPSLDCGIGLAYLPAAIARPGERIEIDVRGRRCPAIIEKKPLYRRPPAATDPAMHAPVG